MLDLTAYTITSMDVHAFASVFFLWVLSKFIGNEQRTFTIAIAAVVLVPSPATLYIVGLFSLVFRMYDIVRP